jgi:hypothetical protein
LALFPLAMRYSRLIPMFVVVALPLVAAGWEAWRPAQPRADDPRVAHTVVLGVVVVATVAWVGAAFAGPDAALAWAPFPTAVVRAVRACPGPVYEQFADGSYVAWFAQGVPVFVDSRVDPYPRAFLRREIAAETRGEYRAAFTRWGIRCAVLSARSATAYRLVADGWVTRGASGGWVVLGRASP